MDESVQLDFDFYTWFLKTKNQYTYKIKQEFRRFDIIITDFCTLNTKR